MFVSTTPYQGPIHVLGAGLSGLAAAILLARAGREVHVHELRADSGARFAGDFQGIENWTSPVDFWAELRAWGIDPDGWKATALREIDLALPGDRIATVKSPRVAFRLVERGTRPHTLDQGLKRQALAAGAHLHYHTRRDRRACHIVATGPRGVTGLVRGELFRTSYPNQVTVQLNDRLAPGAYTYMIVVDGVGLIATVLLRKQRDANRFLDETLAWYHAHYPALDRRTLRRVGGVGSFAVHPRYTLGGRHYVGEAAGLQDCLWGFGIRYAITSGCLAAQALLVGSDYEAAVRRRLVPFQRASLANRWLLNRLGRWGMEGLARLWMWDQERRGDGLPFVSRLYRPSLLHGFLYQTAVRGMLRRRPIEEEEIAVRHLPLAPAKRRDGWAPSAAAREIAAARKVPRATASP
jgi:flavin-dependent dehydrogenase